MISNQKMSQIISLLETGLAPQQITDETNISITTVKHICRNMPTNIPASTGGRSHVLSNQNIQFMIHLLTTGKAISTIDLKLILNSMNISASPWTIY